MLLLDTNVVIPVLNESDPRVAARLDVELVRGAPIGLSAVVLFELRYGIARSARRARNEAVLAQFLALPLVALAFEAEDAAEAGDIRAHLEARGAPIGPYDVLIAAQARRRGAVLVTANGREFARVPGLAVQDWSS